MIHQHVRILLVLALALPSLVCPVRASDSTHTLIPTPQNAAWGNGRFLISSKTRIVLGAGTEDADSFTSRELVDAIAAFRQARVPVVREAALRSLGANIIYVGTPSSKRGAEMLAARKGSFTTVMDQEGYFLDVQPDGIVLLARTPRGRFYGTMTLLQLLGRHQRSVQIPVVCIHDWPSLRFRGITDDLSRGQVSTLEDFKSIIRFLGRYKLNVYSPYIEDIFRFSKHPEIGKNRGALDPSEIRELDRYARAYQVELIPIFETLGHWENILALPGYAHYAEFPGAHTVNVTDENVYVLLDEMIGELAAVFSSPYFNMAADESWDVGLGASKARVAASDLATVHAEHYRRLFAILEKYGKKPLMYGDVILNHPSILEMIPKDVIIVDWQYWGSLRYPSAKVFRDAGFPFLVSPAVWNFTGPFPNYLNTFANVRQFSDEGRRSGSMGLLTSNWNDYGGEALRELNILGYALTAECAWSSAPMDDHSLAMSFFADHFGSRDAAGPAWTAYTILSSPYNQLQWHELWRHPMLPPRESSMVPLWRIQSIRSSMPIVRDLARELRAAALRNRTHADYLEFIADVNLWFAAKVEASMRVRELAADSTLDSATRAALAGEHVHPLILELERVRSAFRGLWLRTNREDNLSLLLRRYDREASSWRETLDALRRGETSLDPAIRSRWIYHPDAHPGLRDTSLTQIPSAEFRTVRMLTGKPISGQVQLIGDTHASLTVNGILIGEVFARRSLSLTVEQERIKVFDITNALREGENVFSVRARNYQTTGSAGFNTYCRITSGCCDTLFVFSDSTWQCRALESGETVAPAEGAKAWRNAAEFPYYAPVIEPNFAAQRFSWIER